MQSMTRREEHIYISLQEVALNEVKWIRKCTFPFGKIFYDKQRTKAAQEKDVQNKK